MDLGEWAVGSSEVGAQLGTTPNRSEESQGSMQKRGNEGLSPRGKQAESG